MTHCQVFIWLYIESEHPSVNKFKTLLVLLKQDPSEMLQYNYSLKHVFERPQIRQFMTDRTHELMACVD